MPGTEGADPSVINAITSTMIGSYLYKYTRKAMGRNGLSDKRHQRYFWVHPYTKMLYWTVSDPGGAGVTEVTSKSACIEEVEVVDDPNPSPPGLYHESILIRTANREMKITAPNRERHEIWLSALGYLVSRDGQSASKPTPSQSTLTSKLRGRASAFGLNSAAREQPQPDTVKRPRGSSIGANSILKGSVSKRKGLPAREFLKQQEQQQQSFSQDFMPVDQSLMQVASMPTRGGARRGRMTDSFLANLSGDDAFSSTNGYATATSADPRLKTAEQMLEEDQGDEWDGIDVSCLVSTN